MSVPAPGWLYLTPNYVCFLSKMAGHTETIPLESLELLVKGSSLMSEYWAGGRSSESRAVGSGQCTVHSVRVIRCGGMGKD